MEVRQRKACTVDMKQPLLIYGAGGLGREVLSMVLAIPEFEPVGFIDDTLKMGTSVRGLKVLGGFDALSSMDSSWKLILAIGSPQEKMQIVRRTLKHTLSFATLVHPNALLQDPNSIRLGTGTIIQAGCILTSDIELGNHVLLNLNCTVGHDTKIGDATSVMPGVNLAGRVSLGQAVLVGSGANIINEVSIGDFSRVGSGAVVIRNVPPHSLAVGVPAMIK